LFSDGEKFDANAVKANFDAIMDNKEDMVGLKV
jgi:nickel (ni2+) ABC superfamily ATP binding cassette transporter binding protein